MLFSRRKIDQGLAALPPLLMLSIALLLLILITLADYGTGSEISFSIFYLAPVALAGWYLGSGIAAVLSLLAASAWLGAELLGGRIYSSLFIPLWNTAVGCGFFLITGYLLARVRDDLTLLRRLAETDGLTGLAVSRIFYARVEQEIARAHRYRHPLTLAYLDLDNFKAVNDNAGHAEGDRVLRTVAKTIAGNLRGSDLAARLGGDEFALLLPETGGEGGRKTLCKLQQCLDRAMVAEGWPVTFSIGALTLERSTGTAREIIVAVDDLMYEVKRVGKNSLLHRIRKG